MGALLNVGAHYDISIEMSAAFLSSGMTYSCPIWRPLSDKKVGEETKDAQMRKLDRFIDNVRLKETDHVLEIGTGWGSFAIRAVSGLVVG
jgi:cyclopropane-fatty-acyl-phospholipid synthase